MRISDWSSDVCSSDLVDEFQDTDPQQWAIFRRLYEAGAARAESGEAEPPLLGLVGDPKQAIYAFRGGDLDTYLVAREYVREHGGADSLEIGRASCRGRVCQDV